MILDIRQRISNASDSIRKIRNDLRKIADDVSEVVANTSIFSLHSNLHHESQNTWYSKYFLQYNVSGLTFLFIVGITYLKKQFTEIHQYIWRPLFDGLVPSHSAFIYCVYGLFKAKLRKAFV